MSLVCILIKKQKGETNTNRTVKLFSFRQKKVFPHWGKKNRHEKERAYPHDTGGTHGAQPDCLEHRLTRAVRWPPRIVLGTLPSVPRHCRKALPRTKRCRRMKPQWAGPAKRGPGAASGAAAGSLPLGLASSRLPPGRAGPCRAVPPVPLRPRGTEGPARLLGGRGNEGPRRRPASASPRPFSFSTSAPDARRLPAEERPRSEEQGSAAARARPGPRGASSQRAAEAPPPPSHPLPAAAAPCRSPFLSARQEPRPERRRGPSEMCRLGMARGEASRPPEAGLKGPRRR